MTTNWHEAYESLAADYNKLTLANARLEKSLEEVRRQLAKEHESPVRQVLRNTGALCDCENCAIVRSLRNDES